MPCVPTWMSECFPASFLVTGRASRTGCFNFLQKPKSSEHVHVESHHHEAIGHVMFANSELSVGRLGVGECERKLSSAYAFDDVSITGRHEDELKGSTEEGGDCDFVLMVDAPIRAEWCLTSADITEIASWKDSSCTGTMKRTWDEFELLETLSAANTGAGSFNAIDVCGKPRGSDINNTTYPRFQDAVVSERKRFLRDVLLCHPDKGGTAESIRAVLEKRRMADRVM